MTTSRDARFGKLNGMERRRLENQFSDPRDLGTVCGGTRGLVEEEIVTWAAEMARECPGALRRPRDLRVQAVSLSKRIMGITNRKLGFAVAKAKEQQ